MKLRTIIIEQAPFSHSEQPTNETHRLSYPQSNLGVLYETLLMWPPSPFVVFSFQAQAQTGTHTKTNTKNEKKRRNTKERKLKTKKKRTSFDLKENKEKQRSQTPTNTNKSYCQKEFWDSRLKS